jgi:uncharacterized Fe-S cluster protein YjdI
MPRRTYTGAHIDVTFDRSLCIHAAECVRGLPAVFDTGRKPWILPDAADAETIAAIVRKCPTGALGYTAGEADQGAAPEVPDNQATVDAGPGHPLFLRGDLVIDRPDGELHLPRAAFCRCGHTANSPFCDLSHLKLSG